MKLRTKTKNPTKTHSKFNADKAKYSIRKQIYSLCTNLLFKYDQQIQPPQNLFPENLLIFEQNTKTHQNPFQSEPIKEEPTQNSAEIFTKNKIYQK